MSFIEFPPEVLIYMIEFLSKKDLDSLSETCKTLRDLIFNTDKLMTKYLLLLDFKNDVDLDKIEALVRQRKFKHMVIIKFQQSKNPEAYHKIMKIASLLSESLDHISMDFCDFNDVQSFSKFISPLKKLKHFVGAGVYCDEYNDVKELYCKDLVNFPIETLHLDIGSTEVLNIFSKCTQVKSFRFFGDGWWHEDVDEFISKQTKLTEMVIGYVYNEGDADQVIIRETWNDAKFELETLRVYNSHIGDPKAAIKFFSKQQKIKKLRINMFWNLEGQDCMQVHQEMVKTICQMPHLEELEFIINSPWNQLNLFDTVTNPTVKNLTIKLLNDDEIATDKLVRSLSSFKAVDINCKYLPLIGVPIEDMKKLTWSGDCSEFVFETEAPPCNAKEFEEAITILLKKSFNKLQIIKIGCQDWFVHEDFQLSVDFCKQFLELCPELESLKIYNVDDVGDLLYHIEPVKPKKNLRISVFQTNSKRTQKRISIKIA